jgi:hypothetical protein
MCPAFHVCIVLSNEIAKGFAWVQNRLGIGFFPLHRLAAPKLTER